MPGFYFMIKTFLFITLISSAPLFSQEFSGCGEYSFKGILRHDENAPLKMSYVIHEGTKSQMIFHLTEKVDVPKLALVLDLPSVFKAKIHKQMDGTKGTLKAPFEIARRYPNPLVSTDSGMTKIQDLKCD